MAINKEVLKGRWKEIQGKVKTQWGKLTDDDITTISGSYDQLEGKLQQVYGYKKEQANQEIATFLAKNGLDKDLDS
jgi:uncharacterized protein YjbJ (UPF0337 family)